MQPSPPMHVPTPAAVARRLMFIQAGLTGFGGVVMLIGSQSGAMYSGILIIPGVIVSGMATAFLSIGQGLGRLTPSPRVWALIVEWPNVLLGLAFLNGSITSRRMSYEGFPVAAVISEIAWIGLAATVIYCLQFAPAARGVFRAPVPPPPPAAAVEPPNADDEELMKRLKSLPPTR